MTGRRTTGERPGSWARETPPFVSDSANDHCGNSKYLFCKHYFIFHFFSFAPSDHKYFPPLCLHFLIYHYFDPTDLGSFCISPAMVRVLHIPPTAFLSASKAFPDDASWPGLSTLLIFQRMFTLSRVNKFHTLLRQINLLGVLTKPRALHALPNADCCCLYTRQKQNQRTATTASGRMPPAMAASGIKVPSCVL